MTVAQLREIIAGLEDDMEVVTVDGSGFCAVLAPADARVCRVMDLTVDDYHLDTEGYSNHQVVLCL